jgi:hypothetical protein
MTDTAKACLLRWIEVRWRDDRGDKVIQPQ